ncbi:NTP transferase domain-containing protein [Candidatus Woesearchaeota archaeon]|nr:NTP transferase domain-containing protein [Candidatus Woesearchaeota archaeon]
MKTRISVSIDREVLSRLDREVDNVKVFSRSEAIEKIIEAHVSEKKKCIILAGGPPEKLYIKELGCYRPLVKVKGHTLIEDIIRKARKANYSEILIIGSKELLSAIYSAIGDGKAVDVTIEYLEEKEPLGSGKTLAMARQQIKNTFLFMPCDHYFEINLEEVEAYHKKNRQTATLVVYSGTEQEWNQSSIVSLEGNIVTKYIEKPKKAETHLTALMIGFAEPEIFSHIPAGRINWSLQENIFAELAKQRKLVGYLYSGKWKNVHSKKDAEELSSQ